MDAPLTTFTGFLRQINPAACDYIAQAAFRSTFANFSSYASKAQDAKAKAAALVKNAHVISQDRPNRRFAGTADFPNGRYSTICADASGDDGRTLLEELAAYSTNALGPFFTFDLGYDSGRTGLGEPLALLPHSPELLLVFDASQLSENSPLGKLIYEHGQEWAERLFHEGRNAIAVEAPYVVAQSVIPNSLDLRQKDAQQWLAQGLTQEKICRFAHSVNDLYDIKQGQCILYNDAAIQLYTPRPEHSFLNWLPALVGPGLGGNGLTESIGRFLRLNKVSALIYPSARANCGVAYRDGQLTGSFGWNLVDYRDAPFQPYDLTVEPDPIDVLEIGSGINLRWIDSGEFAGTWCLLRGLDVKFNDQDTN